jgi:hypothetical protein
MTREGYFGMAFPANPDPQLSDWPLTGKRAFDEYPTEKQQGYAVDLVTRNGYGWRVDPRSITKGIAHGVIAWMKHAERGDDKPMPDWMQALVCREELAK